MVISSVWLIVFQLTITPIYLCFLLKISRKQYLYIKWKIEFILQQNKILKDTKKQEFIKSQKIEEECQNNNLNIDQLPMNPIIKFNRLKKNQTQGYRVNRTEPEGNNDDNDIYRITDEIDGINITDPNNNDQAFRNTENDEQLQTEKIVVTVEDDSQKQFLGKNFLFQSFQSETPYINSISPVNPNPNEKKSKNRETLISSTPPEANMYQHHLTPNFISQIFNEKQWQH